MILLNMPDGGLACDPHKVRVQLMMSSVPYPRGCEHCIRAAFAEALKQALGDTEKLVRAQGYEIAPEEKCPQCYCPKLYPGIKCYGNPSATETRTHFTTRKLPK